MGGVRGPGGFGAGGGLQPRLCGGREPGIGGGLRRGGVALGSGAGGQAGGPGGGGVLTQLESFWRDARVRRVSAWLLFASLCFVAQEFSGVIAGTFILSFLGNSVVNFFEQQAELAHRLTVMKTEWMLPKLTRKQLSGIYIVTLMTIITFVWIFTVPQIISSWRYLKQVIMSDNPYVELAGSIHAILGDDATARLESLLTGIMGTFTPTLKGRGGGAAPLLATQLQRSLKGYLIAALPTFQRLIRSSGAFFYQANISLLFSFICIYDKPNISRGMRKLGQEGSLVKWAYQELAPQIKLFGQLVGKSLEAQFLIASWNTALTGMGMLILGLPGVPVLASLVFVCSFIPLAGVAISTLPMALVALSEGGPFKAFQVFGMIFFVHLLEAYFLNPQIYSSKLKLHPLLVLISLYVTEHIAGVTALFLAVPVTVFVIQVLLSDEIKKTVRLMPDIADKVPELVPPDEVMRDGGGQA